MSGFVQAPATFPWPEDRGNRVNPYERAQALAKAAIGLMVERSVAPTPGNFELFYAYAAGDDPEISRIMGDMIAGRQTLTPTVLEDLRKRFFSKVRLEEAVNSLGKGVSETLDLVLGKLEEAGHDTVAYGQTLSAASGELATEHTPAQQRAILETLKNATQSMELRTKALETELQRSSHEVIDLRRKLEDVRKESLTDPLTGIANRKAFDNELRLAIQQAREKGEALSLLMCDIDRFKQFNDTWGHQTGDQVLRLVANCLSENVKGRDVAARYGGEEFAVILRNAPVSAAVNLADQIRAGVQSKKLIRKSTGDTLGTMTISIGAAELAINESAASLIHRADNCLYAAKSAGRNCVRSSVIHSSTAGAAA